MTHAAETLRREARPLEGSPRDFDALLERIGNARFVLLGEASHGTHEFYRIRAQITRRLIAEKGFRGVAVFYAHPSEQFDAVVHCDVTRAVEPLERFAPVPAGELPETYPWGV
jgi:erythromycin esterase-like protein